MNSKLVEGQGKPRVNYCGPQRFSSASCRSRLASLTSSPPYFVFQPSATCSPAALEAGERNHGCLHQRPDRQTLKDIVKLLDGFGSHHEREGDGPAHRPPGSDLFLLQKLVADVKRGENVLLDESDGLLRTPGTNGISKFHLH